MSLIEQVLSGSCEETARQMSDYADRELAGVSRWRVARHLARCEGCRAVYRALVATIRGLRSLGRAEPPPRPQLVQVVVVRIRREGRL